MQRREEEPLCLVRSLDRLPGTKEIRYNHIFAPLEAEPISQAGLINQATPIETGPESSDRMKQLEIKLLGLEERLNNLEKLLHDPTS